RLGGGCALDELRREVEAQAATRVAEAQAERALLARQGAELDRQVARAARNLALADDDMRADVAASLRGLKADREALAGRLAGAEREAQAAGRADTRRVDRALAGVKRLHQLVGDQAKA